MTDKRLLKWTAESLQNNLEKERDEGWHTGTEYQRLIYRIERLKGFQDYIELKNRYTPNTQ